MYVSVLIMTQTITNDMRYIRNKYMNNQFNDKVIIRINIRQVKGLESSGIMKLWE